MIELRILGTLAILTSDGTGPPLQLTQPKRVALLLYLALAEPAGVHSRESLMALLWPEADGESARHSLRNALYGLRRVLGENAITAHGEGYVGLRADVVRCDALEVRRLLNENQWDAALTACTGDLAPGFHTTGAPEFERWLDDQRAALRQAVTKAAWHRVDELERAADAAAIPAARRAWALDPIDEVGARRLIALLDARIGRAAALRSYNELVEQLRREFDTEPSPETEALAAQIKSRTEPRAGTPSVAAGVRVVSAKDSSVAPPVVSPIVVLAEPTARRGKVWPSAAVAAVVLALAAISLLVFRPVKSVAELRPENVVARAEHEGALRLAVRYRQDTAAYASYLRAMTLRFDEKNIASRDTLLGLIERNPLYAPAYGGLAHAYLVEVMAGAMNPAEGYPKAEAAALKAIALDSTIASAYLALGIVQSAWHWDIAGAGALIDRGIALDPHDPEGHILRGNWFKWRLQPDSALMEYRRASAADPLDASHRDRIARALLLSGHAAEAETTYRETLREYPRRARSYLELADVYRYTGRPLAALRALRMGWTIAGDSGALSRAPAAATDTQATRILIDVARLQLQRAETDARAGIWVPMSEFADAHAALGDTIETLQWLDSMVAHHDFNLCCVRLQPQYDFLRRDRRYQSWEERLPWISAP